METINQRFKLLKEIGKGATSVVYLAEHRRTRLPVAIKKISKSKFSSPEIFSKIKQEIELLRMLHHPFIGEMYEFVSTDDFFFIIMEYIEGGSLLDRINKNGPIAESTAKTIFFQLISAIYYIHRFNIVHRDVKVENILFDGARNVRLIDFGLSFLKNDQHNIMHTQCGSINYAAPEMIKGGIYSENVDVWSAGVVLYTMIVGKLPFNDENMQKLMHNIVFSEPEYPLTMSHPLHDLLEKMLCKDPESRISLREILCHPWVSHAVTPIMSLDSKSVDKEVLESLETLGYNAADIQNSLFKKEMNDGVTAYKITLKTKLLRNTTEQMKKPTNVTQKRKTQFGSLSRQMPLTPLLRPPIILPNSTRRTSMVPNAALPIVVVHNHPQIL